MCPFFSCTNYGIIKIVCLTFRRVWPSQCLPLKMHISCRYSNRIPLSLCAFWSRQRVRSESCYISCGSMFTSSFDQPFFTPSITAYTLFTTFSFPHFCSTFLKTAIIGVSEKKSEHSFRIHLFRKITPLLFVLCFTFKQHTLQKISVLHLTFQYIVFQIKQCIENSFPHKNITGYITT